MMDFASVEIPAVEVADECEPFIVPLARGLQPVPTVEGREVKVGRGDFLFREGDRKTAVYRLDAGILCVTSRRPSGPPNVVEMLFPGSYVGLGFLEQHIDSAMAVVPSVLTEFVSTAISDLCAASPEARERQAVQTEREFEARRRELMPDSDDLPIRRVAAFLSAMYQMNRHEGRNPEYIAEFLKTGDVATFLDLDVEALGRALAALKHRGLVDRAENGGLILLDPDTLEQLSSLA
jgi:CRP/FNR family transcriptional regulator, anaerobic regulatory protein